MRRIDKRQGKFLLTMEPQERELIRQLLDELRELLALSPDDPRAAGSIRPPTPRTSSWRTSTAASRATS